MENQNDKRLHLFLHCLQGLTLSEYEVSLLLMGPLDGPDCMEHIQSPGARAYFNRNKNWLDISERIFEQSAARGIAWCHLGMRQYPQAWRQMTRAPLIFGYRGQPCWQTHPLLAVIGSRTPMDDTKLWMQRELGHFLKNCGVGVVSGGARGVDQWAHRICLDSRQPTVCIFPSGLMDPYPFGGEALWQRILEQGGALISTFSLEEPLRKWAFHIRNRWIAGLSPACFVVEANRRSGSALTAKLAQQEDRAICTLPVFPHSQQGLANLDLIAEGAAMIRDYHDLRQFWDLLVPAGFQAAQCEQQEDDIDCPESDPRVNPAIAGHSFGRQIKDPITHEQN